MLQLCRLVPPIQRPVHQTVGNRPLAHVLPAGKHCLSLTLTSASEPTLAPLSQCTACRARLTRPCSIMCANQLCRNGAELVPRCHRAPACNHRLHAQPSTIKTLIRELVLMTHAWMMVPPVQVTGQPSVLYYATAMFRRAGLAMGQEATGIAGILGAFKLACTCASSVPSPCTACQGL